MEASFDQWDDRASFPESLRPQEYHNDCVRECVGLAFVLAPGIELAPVLVQPFSQALAHTIPEAAVAYFNRVRNTAQRFR